MVTMNEEELWLVVVVFIGIMSCAALVAAVVWAWLDLERTARRLERDRRRGYALPKCSDGDGR